MWKSFDIKYLFHLRPESAGSLRLCGLGQLCKSKNLPYLSPFIFTEIEDKSDALNETPEPAANYYRRTMRVQHTNESSRTALEQLSTRFSNPLSEQIH